MHFWNQQFNWGSLAVSENPMSGNHVEGNKIVIQGGSILTASSYSELLTYHSYLKVEMIYQVSCTFT